MKVDWSNAVLVWVSFYEVLALKVVNLSFASKEAQPDPALLYRMEDNGLYFVRGDILEYLHV